MTTTTIFYTVSIKEKKERIFEAWKKIREKAIGLLNKNEELTKELKGSKEEIQRLKDHIAKIEGRPKKPNFKASSSNKDSRGKICEDGDQKNKSKKEKNDNSSVNREEKEPKNLKGYYYNKLTEEMEPRNNPSPHISSIEPKQLNLPGMENLPIQKEPKIHTPAYRRKYPDRYKKGYVKWYDRDRKEKIVSDLPATAKMNRNVVPKESKPAEIKNSTLLSNLEALHQMSVDDERRAAKFRLDMKPRFLDDFERGVGSLLGVTREETKPKKK